MIDELAGERIDAEATIEAARSNGVPTNHCTSKREEPSAGPRSQERLPFDL